MVDLLATLDEQTTVVASTRRLARYLREQYGLQYAQADRPKAWATPDVLPWSSWIDREFQRLRAIDAIAGEDSSVLLRPHQEQKIWEQIIESEITDLGDHVYQIAATARAVAQARRTARNWRIDLAALDAANAPDARRFHEWNQRFDNYVQTHNLLSSADAVDVIGRSIAAGAAVEIEQLVSTGFDQPTPQQQALFETYASRGVTVTTLQPEQQTAAAVRVSFTSGQEELDAIAGWVRATLTAEPQASIAVVCPDLSAIQRPLARTLSDALEGNHAANGLVDLALGAPLADAPMVRAAFAAFTLLDRQVDVDELGLMLLSPFFDCGVEETSMRARLDVKLRERRRKKLRFSTLHYLLVEHDRLAVLAPRFSELIGSFAKVRASLIESTGTDAASSQAARCSATEWSERLHSFLRHFGWPGERQINHEEFQVQQAWNDLLTDFCALDLVTPPMGLAQAVRELRRLAEDRVHRPRARPAPVQVMSVDDSAGLEFSHLWVAAMSEEVWPPPTRPVSFLPARLQRQAGVGAASAEQAVTLARQITERLKRAAPTVIFSHVSHHEDLQRRPSPLIADLAHEAWPVDADSGSHQRDRVFNSLDRQMLENYSDDKGPPPIAGVAGGTSMFSDQAKCPFRGFARHRLGARSLEVLGTGLDPLERGQLVHDALEEIWRNQLRSHKDLMAKSDDQLKELIKHVVAQTLNKERRQAEQLLSTAMAEIESRRLQDLLFRWLQVERRRGDDFRVESIEENVECDVAGVRISLRSDRVDRTDEDRLVIIDYKTGKPTLGDWLADRPTDLQVPIYAHVLGFDKVEAIAFVQVRVGDEKFVGIARDAKSRDKLTVVEKVRSPDIQSWEDLSQHLNDSIVLIGREITAGHAIVDPAKGVCDRCDLTALCRISRWRNGLLEEEATDVAALADADPQS